MEKQTIKELIGRFLHNDIPPGLRTLFRRWMVQPDDSETKEEALQEEWETIVTAPEAADRSEELRRLHHTIRMRDTQRRRERTFRRLRYAAAAAAVLLFAVGEYYYVRSTTAAPAQIRLVTARGSKGEFLLPDGTKVWLNGESRLTYDAAFSGKTRDVALTGEAFFEVNRDTLRPFRVAMNDLRIEVLGTSFDAMSYASASHEQIVLRTGSVRITGEYLRRPVVLRPDEKFSLDRISKRASVERVDARNYCQWFSPRLVFDNTPLRDIVTNLERRYNIEIALSSHISPDKRLSLVVCHEPLEDLMEVISTLMSIDYRIEGNRVLIMRK